MEKFDRFEFMLFLIDCINDRALCDADLILLSQLCLALLDGNLTIPDRITLYNFLKNKVSLD